MMSLVIAYSASAFGDKEGIRVPLALRPISIYVNGEPEYTTHIPSINAFDLALLNSGAEAHKNAFYVPFWLGDVTCSSGHHARWYADKRWSTAAVDRPIDMLYVSSNCNARREALVGALRQKVENSGGRFEYGGKCAAGSRKPRVPANVDCDVCFKAKMMVSVSRTNKRGWQALDEKLLLPNLYGAVPVYAGNGERLAETLGWNVSWWLSATTFQMPSNDRIDSMRTQFPCHSVCTRVRHYMQKNNLVVDKPTVVVQTQQTGPFWRALMRCVFGETKTIVLTGNTRAHADATIVQCCW